MTEMDLTTLEVTLLELTSKTKISQSSSSADNPSMLHSESETTETSPLEPSNNAIFHYFPYLPLEIRLQIWHAAHEIFDYSYSRIVNLFVRSKPQKAFRPRLLPLNMKHLHRTDGFNSLLGTNYEAREATLTYLASHPRNDIRDSRYRRYQRYMCLPYLARDLRRARFDPVKDVLFLNGLDVEYDALPPDEASALLLPGRLREDATMARTWDKHTRHLDLSEVSFLTKFRNVMMPVYGLVDQAQPEGLFDDIMYPDTVGWYPHARLRDRVFIALVGHYPGRNLQMEDIEFIPKEKVDRIRREGIKAMGEPGTGRRRAASVLHRDVLVMTAVWAMWNSRHEQRWKYLASETVKNLREEFRRSLRFARVKTEGL